MQCTLDGEMTVVRMSPDTISDATDADLTHMRGQLECLMNKIKSEQWERSRKSARANTALRQTRMARAAREFDDEQRWR